MRSTSSGKTRLLTFLVVLGLGIVLLTPLFIFSFLRIFDLSIRPTEIYDSVEIKRISGTAAEISSTIYLFSDSTTYTFSSPGYLDETVLLHQEMPNTLVEVTLTPLPGYLDIHISQHFPVSVTIDGQTVANLIGIELSQGEYTVGLFHDDDELTSKTILIHGLGERQIIEFDLAQYQAHVSVETLPRSAKIELDGQEIGYGAFTGGVAVGNHEIRVTQIGYRTKSIDFEVNAGDRADLGQIELVPLPVTAEIETMPTNASVLVDGEFIGESSLSFQLMPGKSYELIARKPGFEDRKIQLAPQIGKDLTQTINFEEKTIEVSVEINPAGSVFVNGYNQGQAPVTVSLYSNDYLEARSPGLVTQAKRIDHIEGRKQNLKFELLEPAEHAYRFAPQTLRVVGDLELERFPSLSYTQASYDSNTANRQVVLTRPFYLGKTEVTNKAFNAFTNATKTPDAHPATGVSWLQAVRFCNWLSIQEGLDPVYDLSGAGVVQSVDTRSLGFRLPTELEWEAGAGFDWRANIVAEPYPWGAIRVVPIAIGNLAGQETQGLRRRFLTDLVDDHTNVAPVATYSPNFNGLYDMTGNVAEWVHDFYEIKRHSPSADYLGPKFGITHVVKGSSFESSSMAELEVYARQNVRTQEPFVGFRIAKWIH